MPIDFHYPCMSALVVAPATRSQPTVNSSCCRQARFIHNVRGSVSLMQTAWFCSNAMRRPLRLDKPLRFHRSNGYLLLPRVSPRLQFIPFPCGFGDSEIGTCMTLTNFLYDNVDGYRGSTWRPACAITPPIYSNQISSLSYFQGFQGCSNEISRYQECTLAGVIRCHHPLSAKCPRYDPGIHLSRTDQDRPWSTRLVPGLDRNSD